jgi:hypothetical protein
MVPMEEIRTLTDWGLNPVPLPLGYIGIRYVCTTGNQVDVVEVYQASMVAGAGFEPATSWL